jgi:hypothetical protein
MPRSWLPTEPTGCLNAVIPKVGLYGFRSNGQSSSCKRLRAGRRIKRHEATKSASHSEIADYALLGEPDGHGIPSAPARVLLSSSVVWCFRSSWAGLSRPRLPERSGFPWFPDGGKVDVSPIVRQLSPPCNRDKGPTLARQVWRRSRRAERISYGRSRPCSAPATWKWNFGAAAAVLLLPLLRATHATRLWSGGDLGHQLLELHTAGFNRLLVGEIADRPTAFEHPDIAPISISSSCCI